MGRLVAMSCVLFLAFGCATASAQDANALEQRYSHIQDLNNAGSAIVYAKSPGPNRLHQAIGKLKQAQAAITQLQAGLAVGSRYAERVNDRHDDNLRYQADAYAQLGDEQSALDALEGLTTDGVWSGWKQVLLKDKYLAGLHDDPRFKALLSRFDAVADRWNADAFMTPATHLSEAQRIAGLSLFWSEVRYNFAHFARVPKLDWNQTYLDFLPKVIAAKDLHDYYDVLMRLAPLLHDGHTNIYPPDSIANQFYARPPVVTALIQNHVVVTWVADPGIAAEGVHVGDEIVSINGEEVHRYAREHVEPYVSSSTPQDLAVRMYDYLLLAGDHAQPVTLGLKDAAGKLHSVPLSREPDPAAKKWKPSFSFRMLPGDIAYLELGEFEDARGAKLFEQHLPQILKGKGLILDVRGNGGGSTSNGLDVLTWLTDKPVPEPATRSLEYIPTYRAWSGPSETWKTLDGPDNTYTHLHKTHYAGPVAVLIGPRTFSAAEDFVVSFEAMKRGILVGEPTAGSTGQPFGFALPGGGSARVCTLQERFPDGRKFVGTGIPPQIEVEPTVADIRAGRDPGIAAAVKALLAESAQH